MKDDAAEKLFAEIRRKINQAETIAGILAVQYVKNSRIEDRNECLRKIEEADVWKEAEKLARAAIYNS